MQGIEMQIQNAQAVQNALNSFEKKIARKVVREGLQAVMQQPLRDAKRNARELDRSRKPGVKKTQRMGHLIAKNLVLQTIRTQELRKRYGRDAYGKRIWTRPKVKDFYTKTKAGELYYIPSAIEYGHAFPGGGGSGAKDVAAIPFIRPVWDRNKPHLPKDFEKYLDLAIAEENAKK